MGAGQLYKINQVLLNCWIIFITIFVGYYANKLGNDVLLTLLYWCTKFTVLLLAFDHFHPCNFADGNKLPY